MIYSLRDFSAKKQKESNKVKSFKETWEEKKCSVFGESVNIVNEAKFLLTGNVGGDVLQAHLLAQTAYERVQKEAEKAYKAVHKASAREIKRLVKNKKVEFEARNAASNNRSEGRYRTVKGYITDVEVETDPIGHLAATVSVTADDGKKYYDVEEIMFVS